MVKSLLRSGLLPTFEILLFLLVFWASLVFMPDMLNSDGDLGRHITVGNYILDTRSIPARDVFSDTRYDAPLVLHEWLSEVVFALAYRAASLNGVAWLTALLLATIYFVLAVGLRALGVSAPVAFLAALAAYLTGMIHQLPRPHLFTLLLFTLLLILLERYRRRDTERDQCAERYDERSLLLLIPILVLWANLNGAFVLAFFVLGVYSIGALLEGKMRRAVIFLALLGATFVASFVNPCAAQLPFYVFRFMGNRFLVDNTVEYLSPNFHTISAWMFAVWILFSILLFGRRTPRVNWTSLLLLGAWTAFGLYSARNIANYAQVAALVTMPIAEFWLGITLPSTRTWLANLNQVAPLGGGWLWAIGVVALLISLQANGARLDARGSGNVFTEPTFPVNAVNFLERNPPPGKMFNEYTWGGYLEYRLFPSVRVLVAPH
ncbi:hypothetical protein FBQ82_00460 [Anaerolineae bacterium CFX7]|nr:hypothetical protein [Anaerolineae bacterium CFX7]